MLRRLFTLVLLLAILVIAYYYWRTRQGPVVSEPLGDLGQQLREVPQNISDAKVTAAVKAALELNRNLEMYSFDVDTENGVVTLQGELASEDLKRMAERTATAVPDVREVRSELRVNPALGAKPADRSLGEKMDDEALKAKVNLAFSLNRNLKGSDIEVRSFRRQVTLSGELERADQRPLALQIARQTSGVEGVKDEMRLRGEAPPASLPPSASPAEVEQKIRANPSLSGYDLRVREEGGRLVLTGAVRTAAERDLAGLLAKEAAGRPVENAVEIKP